MAREGFVTPTDGVEHWLLADAIGIRAPPIFIGYHQMDYYTTIANLAGRRWESPDPFGACDDGGRHAEILAPPPP